MTPHGPFRLAAIQEGRAGYCLICDMRPLKEPSRSKGRGSKYTCGQAACLDAWSVLASMDIHRYQAAAKVQAAQGAK